MAYQPLSDKELKDIHTSLRAEFDYATRTWRDPHYALGAAKADMVVALLALEKEIRDREASAPCPPSANSKPLKL
ncbi:MAG: hypothetical protein IT560_13610 [Alphaproteobacteria bacterium]|nr:hypothetical protein [Alphaproteobacteria bacterium]